MKTASQKCRAAGASEAMIGWNRLFSSSVKEGEKVHGNHEEVRRK
jgi:hypothetical protein